MGEELPWLPRRGKPRNHGHESITAPHKPKNPMAPLGLTVPTEPHRKATGAGRNSPRSFGIKSMKHFLARDSFQHQAVTAVANYPARTCACLLCACKGGEVW